jgi:hypothetical protein
MYLVNLIQTGIDIRHQTPAEKGEREPPLILEFITNYTKRREIFIALISRIMRNRRQTPDIRLQPRREGENSHEFTNNGEWTPDIRRQTSTERGEREPPLILEFITNYTKRRGQTQGVCPCNFTN